MYPFNLTGLEVTWAFSTQQYTFLTLLVTISVMFVVHVKKIFQNVYYILLSHTTGTGMNIMYTTKTPTNPRFLAFSFSQPMSCKYFHLGDVTANVGRKC
jgi:hypothetical protein